MFLNHCVYKTASSVQIKNTEISYDPVIQLTVICQKIMKTLIKNIYIYTPMFKAALFTTAKTQKQLKCLYTND